MAGNHSGTEQMALQTPHNVFFLCHIQHTCSRLTSCDLHTWGVMAESSGAGHHPGGSGSTEACPGMRSTKENSLWSHRKGSLVSSAAWQRGGQGQMQLEDKTPVSMCIVFEGVTRSTHERPAKRWTLG